MGTVIHGTHRKEDLIPAFLDEVILLLDAEAQEDTRLPLDSDEIDLIHVFVSEVGERMRSLPNYFDTEEADADLEELFDTLNSMAQEGEYFGALEGDGSDFGWWNIVDDFFDYGEG